MHYPEQHCDDNSFIEHVKECTCIPPEKHFFFFKMASNLVDGGGLRPFLCDPIHTLRSSGYALSGIYISQSRI